MKKPGYQAQRLSRFGLLNNSITPCDIWCHCASVGEVTVAAKLLEELLKQQGDLRIAVSTTTTTGAQQVRHLLGERVQHLYMPYDFPLFVNRVFRRLQPAQLLIVEVELWPNLIHCAWRQGVKVTLVNARMTLRSLKSYQKLSALIQPLFAKVSQVFPQGQQDRTHFALLGVREDKLYTGQNIKFDIPLVPLTDDSPLRRRLNIQRRPVLVAGSTHDPEESLCLKALQQLRSHWPDILLIIVPRYPERFDTVELIISDAGEAYIKSSDNTPIPNSCHVLLVNQMGVLSQYFALADMAFVGGSVAQRGGHNALEPASLAKPVLMGPSQYNNADICQRLSEVENLKTITNSDELATQCQQWLESPTLRQEQGLAGRKVVETNAGAVAAISDVILR